MEKKTERIHKVKMFYTILQLFFFFFGHAVWLAGS